MLSGGQALQMGALLVALIVACALLVLLRRQRRPTGGGLTADPASAQAGGARIPSVGVVLNPIKMPDVEERRRWIAEVADEHGYRVSGWEQTTIEDPGAGQAERLRAGGADVVIVHGGDGTVREAASALAGTPTALGLLPAGTGNLLARNLGVAVTDLRRCLDIALAGEDRAIDIGRAVIDVSGEDELTRPLTFLVMAGLGFDAEVMAAVEPRLKARFGWWAYVMAGAQQMRGRQTRVTVRLDDGTSLHRRVRTVIIGNCGELTGGVRLMPDARVDDGWLDVVIVAPRGVVGWAAVTATVLTRSRRGHPVVEHFRCRRVEVRAERPLPVQLDGDPIGVGRVLRAEVVPGALTVRTPPPA